MPTGPRRPPRPQRPPLEPVAATRPTMPTRAVGADREDLNARLAQLEQRRNGGAPRQGIDQEPAPDRRRRRRHPAMAARLGAVVMTLASSTALTAYFAHGASHASHPVGAAAVVVAGGPVGSASVATDPSSTSVDPSLTATTDTSTTADMAAAPTTPPPTAAPTTRPPTTAPRANAVVDGGTFQNQYGPVQVQATFNPSGQLVAANAIQSPAGRRTSIEINQQAVPELDANALSIQNAQVDTVSGATYTSGGYRQSLQSAIDAARAAHVTTIA